MIRSRMPGGCLESSAVYHVQQLIEDVHHQPTLRDRLATSREDVFTEYGLTDEQKAALRDGALPRLMAIGVHPILCLQWSLVTNDEIREHLTIDSAYLRQMEGL